MTTILEPQPNIIPVSPWGSKQKLFFTLSQLLPVNIFLFLLYFPHHYIDRSFEGYAFAIQQVGSFLFAIVINKLWANYRNIHSWMWVIGWSLLQYPLFFVLGLFFTIIFFRL
ncbi:MAG: hypothetical protein UX54_C0014G0002 [Parcubacteria group bacterium GW2011_GWA2_46_39]|nr:MAG: hypothetical protein UX54_C0014G0002 [Parcubacteria group bacterium GW2011_GWA2_46_39]